MFNFTTGRKQGQQTSQSGVAYPEKASVQAGAENMSAQQDYINSQVEELEAQRRAFMKKKPDFDMKAEMENPNFVNYVWKNKLSIEDAYFLAHKEEIMDEAISEAVARLNARRDRIAENGAGKNSPASVKKNPKEMSDKEIDSIIERVRNGEKITF